MAIALAFGALDDHVGGELHDEDQDIRGTIAKVRVSPDMVVIALSDAWQASSPGIRLGDHTLKYSLDDIDRLEKYTTPGITIFRLVSDKAVTLTKPTEAQPER